MKLVNLFIKVSNIACFTLNVVIYTDSTSTLLHLWDCYVYKVQICIKSVVYYIYGKLLHMWV